MTHQQNGNSNIKCSVSSCKYHNAGKSLCSLSSIQVGTCGPASKDCACTECASFELSMQHGSC